LNERAIGRLREMGEDNIKMEFKEIECEVVVWVGLSQECPEVGLCENGYGPSGSMKADLVGLVTVTLSRRTTSLRYVIASQTSSDMYA
jgi:hypothetical protein